MSFVYFKFLFINTIKRKSIWITWLLFLFTCTCFIIILPLAATMNTLQVWANTTMSICQTFMGMVAGLFTAVLAINIFKDTNEEGTELIVISKPISRMKIVLSKFILFGFYCLLINISTVLLSAFTIFLPRTEPQFYAGLLISMFIGNAVTFGIFGSIAILMTVNFAKVGIIVVNIIISLVFLIYQALTLFVFATPLRILDNNSMSASSYIIHERNMETGEYVEDEVVQFSATPLENGNDHPCQAKNWKEMKEYWEGYVKGQDVTPILNATDLASQVALTYLSYNTDAYALRQSNRMFGLSRFYDYKLTSPASPEIIAGVENKKSLKCVYADTSSFDLGSGLEFYYPTSFGFEGIAPLTGTRLRGYGDQVPVGYIRSKELLSAREVFFEKDEWNKYKSTFNEMYDDVYKPEYYDLAKIDDPTSYSQAFSSSTNNMSIYYDKVWHHLIDNKTLLDIKNIDDLNDRFIQYKNFAYWRVWEEQNKLINYGIKPASVPTTYDNNEKDAKTHVYQSLNPTFMNILKIELSTDGWYIKCIEGATQGFLENNTATIGMNYLVNTWELEKSELLKAAHTEEEVKEAAQESSLSVFKKTEAIYNTTCAQSENYLYDSFETSHRSNKYRGTAHVVTDTWTPYMYGLIAQMLELETSIPMGQNMMYFFYETNPTLQYWMFAVIWGSISVALFAAGIVIYNKYDIK